MNTRPWWLHGERPNGAHSWLPFRTWAQFVYHVEHFCPHVPADTVWNVTADTRGGT